MADRRAFLCLVGAALGAGLGLPRLARAQASSFEGTLELVDMRDRSLAVRTSRSTERVRVTDLTLIVVASRPAALSDLRAGQRVRVQLQVTTGGALTERAARITVLPAR